MRLPSDDHILGFARIDADAGEVVAVVQMAMLGMVSAASGLRRAAASVVTDRVLLWKSGSSSPSWWTTLAEGGLPHNHHKPSLRATN
jgi:hypothetical protein